MITRSLFICILSLLSLNSFAQIRLKVPSSIYNNFNGEKLILSGQHANLTLDKYKFRIIDTYDLVRNSFIIDFANIGRKASLLDYDSYKNLALIKYHDKGVDLYERHAFLYREWKQEQRNLKRNANKPIPVTGRL